MKLVVLIGLIALIVFVSGCSFESIPASLSAPIPCESCNDNVLDFAECMPMCEAIFNDAGGNITGVGKSVDFGMKEVYCVCKGTLKDSDPTDPFKDTGKIIESGKKLGYYKETESKQCKGEGETIPVIAEPPECCEGLELIPPKEQNIVGISGTCTAKCGNGTCDEETESEYNCQQDCIGEFKNCENSEDCIVVDASVCSCNYMGKATSINKIFKDSWEEKLSLERTENTVCPAAISQHISCFSVSSCINSQCELIPDKEQVCNSLLFLNCKENNSPDIRPADGVSCLEVNEMCSPQP